MAAKGKLCLSVEKKEESMSYCKKHRIIIKCGPAGDVYAECLNDCDLHISQRAIIRLISDYLVRFKTAEPEPKKSARANA